MNELPREIERAMRDLDARAARRAAGIDPDRVADRVLARLRAESATPRRVRILPFVREAPRWAGVAAAALIVIGAGTMAAGLLRPGAKGDVALPVVAQALDSLDVGGLESLLKAAGDVRPLAVQPVRSAAGTWDDLSEEQLRAVLQAVQQPESRTL